MEAQKLRRQILVWDGLDEMLLDLGIGTMSELFAAATCSCLSCAYFRSFAERFLLVATWSSSLLWQHLAWWC